MVSVIALAGKEEELVPHVAAQALKKLLQNVSCKERIITGPEDVQRAIESAKRSASGYEEPKLVGIDPVCGIITEVPLNMKDPFLAAISPSASTLPASTHLVDKHGRVQPHSAGELAAQLGGFFIPSSTLQGVDPLAYEAFVGVGCAEEHGKGVPLNKLPLSLVAKLQESGLVVLPSNLAR